MGETGEQECCVGFFLFVLHQQGHKAGDNFNMNSIVIALLRLEGHLQKLTDHP